MLCQGAGSNPAKPCSPKVGISADHPQPLPTADREGMHHPVADRLHAAGGIDNGAVDMIGDQVADNAGRVAVMDDIVANPARLISSAALTWLAVPWP